MCGGLERTDFSAIDNLGRYGGLERTPLLTVSTQGGCGGLERTDFNQFILWSVWWS